MHKNLPNLKAKLIQKIKQNGPISIDVYMDACLNDPDFGYYKTQNPFGIKGDFITSPEISQMFGEMVAIFLIHNHQTLNFDQDFILCEIGSGRGTFMVDILTTIEKIAPLLLSKSHIFLIETSDRLKVIQKKALKKWSDKIQFKKNIEDLPKKPLFFIANELLDALPICQFFWKNKQLFERMVDYDAQNKKLSFEYQIIAQKRQEELQIFFSDQSFLSFSALEDEKIFEISPIRFQFIQEITNHIINHQSMALLFDYGSLSKAYGDTLQSMTKHKYSDVLMNPGQDDITSHVDFYHLAAFARKNCCATFGMNQAKFLLKMGIEARLNKLSLGKSSLIKTRLENEFQQLISPKKMGELFKALLITHKEELFFPFSREDLLKD